MPIQFNCPACGKSYSVADHLAGKQAKCKACKATMPVPFPITPPEEEEDQLGYIFKEDPYAVESQLGALPPKPTPAAAVAKKKSGSRKGLRLLLYVVGGIASTFLVLFAICCGALSMMSSGVNEPLGPTLEQRLQSIAYRPIAAPSSSHSIPGSNVRVAFVQSYGAGPAGTMQLRIYMPPGEHAANSLPCVLIAPAGSTLLHGSEMDDDDYHDETLPYAEAGMVVIFYSLDGSTEADEGYQASQGPMPSYQRFHDACAGVANGRNVVDYVIKHLPQVNPRQIYTAGHSSAGTLSLLLASHESRIAGAVAYAPCIDVKGGRSALLWIPSIQKVYPGIKQFLSESSPQNRANKINCPVFLFHARDDSNVDFSESLAYSKQLTQAGVDVTFVPAETGDHYDSMIDEGVPQGVEWIKKHAGK